MNKTAYMLLLTLSLLLARLCQVCQAVTYTNTWAAHIEGGIETAKKLADTHDFILLGKIFGDYYHLKHKRVSKRSVNPSPAHHASLSQEPQVKWIEQQVAKKRKKRDIHFNDPKWPAMWYLNRGNGLDMKVERAWEQGITGKGVVVTILDDGIETDHPDLSRNYDKGASYDVNNHDPDPQPRYDPTNENRHGTRCAGEVAAVANNGLCSVGVAHNAGIGGVRMLDGDVTDAVEAQSLSLNPQHIDIYSASWGPDDDGRTVDGPATLANKAFYDGISMGRGGLGSIFVWASGNGGRDGDSCNCDGYTNSIYTLSISSATENGHIPWYSEPCSSTLATTYSSGSGVEKQVVTTDLRRACTDTHTGTSASAPLAAGIVALALQAQPHLTWRDLQHIVVRTARPTNLHSSDWITNGVGRQVSHSFGFGLMDAEAMVNLARNWTTVPTQHACEIHASFTPRSVRVGSKLSFSLESDGCAGTPNYVRYLEHVQSIITLTSTRRGEVEIYLVSPQGTRSTLLQRRSRDTSHEGFSNWAFMTTHNWGEFSMGRWRLEVQNGAGTFHPAKLRSWTLVLYGTDRDPYRPTTTTSTTFIPTPTSPPHPTKPRAVLPGAGSRRLPGHIAMVEPCSKPRTKTPKYLIHSAQAFPGGVARPSTTSTTVATTTTTSAPVTGPAVLKAWTLVLRGTATEPQNGIRQAPKQDENEGPICPDHQYALDRYCYDQCPANFFATTENLTVVSKDANGSKVIRRRMCQQCHMLCMKCHGPLPQDCDHCASGFQLNQYSICERARTKFIDKDLIGFLIIALAVCVAAFALFIVLFVTLQARDHGWFCFHRKNRYTTADIPERTNVNGAKVDFRLMDQGRPFLASDSDDEVFSTNHDQQAAS